MVPGLERRDRGGLAERAEKDHLRDLCASSAISAFRSLAAAATELVDQAANRPTPSIASH